jgi:hypothetical protein
MLYKNSKAKKLDRFAMQLEQIQKESEEQMNNKNSKFSNYCYDIDVKE